MTQKNKMARSNFEIEWQTISVRTIKIVIILFVARHSRLQFTGLYYEIELIPIPVIPCSY